jgi:hypothetical protein
VAVVVATTLVGGAESAATGAVYRVAAGLLSRWPCSRR